VIRCDIIQESVEKSRDVESETISMGYTLRIHFKTPPYFVEDKEDTLET
jgi:hypothetical protein